mmetsp:Transcript_1818/g.2873  ORF Transcript_1818/g.2873 Transcript_1818/m.2873 type:complete len:282 (+) Transcript_1818:127-972(+)|eukprot:CAMPEP_0185024094 /NCGR_PEP_ID=MMETSP1103-20130426/7007_1 /TAXON_ID=36769 /ORGANISM="Paraphysomonas bandaiensis, Strain Caron Lab Isolate" /LENGTH=281 /DNA_ID=CAMNT_0027556955 /DNA_START=103 /DNA_END=948 /DNA_ORIENTATION=-
MEADKITDSRKNKGATTGSENTGRWTPEEHALFLKGLELYGKGWKNISLLVKTRSVVQIRTHAQKYFLKQQKDGNIMSFKAPISSPKRGNKKKQIYSSNNESESSILESFRSYMAPPAPVRQPPLPAPVHEPLNFDENMCEFLTEALMNPPESEVRPDPHPSIVLPSVKVPVVGSSMVEWDSFDWMDHRHISEPIEKDVLDSSDDSEYGFEPSDCSLGRRIVPNKTHKEEMGVNGEQILFLDTGGDGILDSLDLPISYDTHRSSGPPHYSAGPVFVSGTHY